MGYGYVSVVMISIMSDRSSSNVDDHSNAGHDYGNDNEINGSGNGAIMIVMVTLMAVVMVFVIVMVAQMLQDLTNSQL